MVVRVGQTFQFFRQNNWFLKNKRAFFKFLFGILYYLIKAKKSCLVSGNRPGENSRVCRIYVFCFKQKNTEAKAKETKENRKTKETN